MKLTSNDFFPIVGVISILCFVIMCGIIGMEETNEQKKSPDIVISEWNKDGSFNRKITGKSLTINGLGWRGDKTNCYAVNISGMDTYIVVSRNPDIWSGGSWGSEFAKEEFKRHEDYRNYYSLEKKIK